MANATEKPRDADDGYAYAAVQSPRTPTSASAVDATDDPWKRNLTSPLDRAHWLSQFTLWWINAMVGRGYKSPLEEDDVWELPASDKASVLQARFDQHYADAVARHHKRHATKPTSASSSSPPPPPAIHWAMWHATKDKMDLAIVLHLVSSAANLLQPLVIKALLQNLRGDENLLGISSGYALAGLLTAAALVAVQTLDYGQYLMVRAGINARMIVVNSVYQKLLRLTSTARLSMNSGDIITLAGVDSDRLFEAYSIGIWALISPLVVFSACVMMGFLLSVYVALAAGAGSVVILAYAVINSRKIGKTRRRILEVAGERVKVTNEVLQGIRVIKMYAWEASIADRVAAIRAREVQLLRRYDYLRVTNLIVLTYAQTFLTVLGFLVYVYEGNTLTVPTTFAFLALVNACGRPFAIFSNAVVFSSEGWASMQRIAAFLAADQVTFDHHTIGSSAAHVFQPLLPGQPIVEIQNAAFSWLVPTPAAVAEVESASGTVVHRPTLRNINLRIAPGSLTIVVGAVGSGKSSLVSALLGEMDQLQGTRAVRGAVAYASQEAWIQHSTVRNNILFGTAFEAEYYQRVLAACQLLPDLAILEHGDATEIGERGINLSGGQKARVSLARAMYRREADLVVLDDPLSALDVHVANAVFFQCLQGLVASKTRLLVLNAHYHLLKHADRILLLSDGEIVGDGTYEEVRAQFAFLEDQAHEKAAAAAHERASRVKDIADAAVLNAETDNIAEEEERQRWTGIHSAMEVETPETMERASVSTSQSRASRRSSRVLESVVELETPAVAVRSKTMMMTEDRAVGAITFRTYVAFLETSGFNGAVLLAVLFVVFASTQCGAVAADYFVTFWSNGSLDQFSQETLVWIYCGVALGAVVLGILRAALFVEICIKCAKVVHARYFTKVLMAPVNTFFDVTPVGRVLNRFSRDLDQIDNPLPYYTLQYLIYAVIVLSVLVVCAVTTPTTLVVYGPLIYGSSVVQKYYLASSRELKRLDGVTRSPFLNLVGETINGIESIRAYRMTDSFSRQCRDLLDYNAKFYFMFQATSRWFAMRLDWFVTTVVAVVSFTCVASRDSIGPASVGIALTYAVQLTMYFQRLLNLGSQTENVMTSYERIAHYGTLDEEGDTKQAIVAKPPPAAWPTKGSIEFTDVYLRYRDGLDFVLRGVTFGVQDGEKIGVCGRTGSGKSTLMNALFRTVEAAQGIVRIDGVDIATVKLQHLRSKLTIIPQDPVLFSGTLRDNLDPFSEKSDDELFSALRKVHLIEDVSRWGQGLSYEVSEKGENLSVGQRQLICIARALLRESRIVVLDEATASVDQELDRLIQVAVKECFQGRTSLTIAHRLETIADSDRILVMDQGHVAEFDSPSNLLAKSDGLFASLMKSTQH